MDARRPRRLLPLPLPLPLLLLAALLPLLAEGKLPLPSYIKRCSVKLSKQEMTKCAVQSANAGIPSIKDGDRKYRVPSFNPLLVDRMLVDDGQGPLGLNMMATDAQVFGLPNATINYIEFDFKDKKVRYDAYVPSVNIQSKYNVSGRILLLPITGYGDANLTLKNVFVTYEYDFSYEKQDDGEIYFVPKPHTVFRFNTTRLYIHLSNLFNGDKLLGETTNTFMDENWEELLESLGPIFSTAISEIIHNILTNIFKLVPFKDAFLDAEAVL